MLKPIFNKQTPKVNANVEDVGSVKSLCEELLDFAKTYNDPKLAGLAANQMEKDGKRIKQNICFIMKQDESWVTAINPSIIKRSKEILEGNQEGCLTWPKKTIVADRHESVVVSYTDLNGATQVEDVNGFEAIVWQHEINHLEGNSEMVINPKTGKIYGPSVEDGGTIVLTQDKVGRNDPCPCDSGKKYKKCCGRN
jgi:peptide deformylase